MNNSNIDRKVTKSVAIDLSLIDYFEKLAKKEERSFSFFVNLALQEFQERENQVDTIAELFSENEDDLVE